MLPTAAKVENISNMVEFSPEEYRASAKYSSHWRKGLTDLRNYKACGMGNINN